MVSVGVGRAKTQAIGRQPSTAKARVRFQISPCEISGGQVGTGTGFYPSISVFPSQYNSTIAPYSS